MKVLLLNNYDLAKIKQEWQVDGQAGHQLWGYTKLESYGIKVDILPYKGSDKLKQISQKIKLLGDIDQQFRLLKQLSQYDLIYSGNFYTTSLLGFLRRFRLINTPILAISFQSPRSSLISQIFAQLTIAGNDKIICLSDGIRQHLEQQLKVFPEKLESVEWGYDTNFHSPQPSNINYKKQEGYVLSIGKTFRDYSTLISAFKQIDSPLEIIGYSDDIVTSLQTKSSNIKATLTLGGADITQESLSAIGRLPGDVKVVKKLLSTAQLLAKYQNAYAVAIPTMLPEYKSHNTVGLSSMLEAMCMGKAVIATENRYMGIDLEQNGIGITVPVGDRLAWQQAVKYVVEHPDVAREMGEKARYLAEKKYNLDNFTQKIARCMQEVVYTQSDTSVFSPAEI